MADYTITLINELEGTSQEIICADDCYILDAADDEGMSLPYSCRAGACSTCAGILVTGNVNQDDQSYLDEDQLNANWVLTCVAYPESNCVIKTHKEEELY